MPRNYKRDRGGRFAKVNSLKGKKLNGLAGRSTPRKGHVVVAVRPNGKIEQLSPAQIRQARRDNRHIAAGAAGGALAFGTLGAVTGGPVAGAVGATLGARFGAASVLATKVTRRQLRQR